jgi:hypothetical protein
MLELRVLPEICVEEKQRPLAFRFDQSYRRDMPSDRTSLGTLKRLVTEADLILSTTELPENRTAGCRELLGSAIALADDLISQTKLPAAAQLGSRGGTATAKRGSDYFRQLAAKRKTLGGGRPRKEA